MIVLDTNVISELMKTSGDPRVVAWVNEQPEDEVYLTAVTTAELRYGVARLPDGRRKADLADRVWRTLAEDFNGRILSFNDQAAACYADIVVHRERRGVPNQHGRRSDRRDMPPPQRWSRHPQRQGLCRHWHHGHRSVAAHIEDLTVQRSQCTSERTMRSCLALLR